MENGKTPGALTAVTALSHVGTFPSIYWKQRHGQVHPGHQIPCDAAPNKPVIRDPERSPLPPSAPEMAEPARVPVPKQLGLLNHAKLEASVHGGFLTCNPIIELYAGAAGPKTLQIWRNEGQVVVKSSQRGEKESVQALCWKADGRSPGQSAHCMRTEGGYQPRSQASGCSRTS